MEGLIMKKFMLSLIAVILVMACAVPALAVTYKQSDLKRTLSTGCKDTDGDGKYGSDVTMVQNRLAHFGYYTGAIDGVFSVEMRQAVVEFQTANYLKVDGKVGTKTWAKLIAKDADVVKATDPKPVYQQTDLTETLSEGSKGEKVKIVQQLLTDYGYYSGEINGIYGNTLKWAVYDFQSANNLHHDGKVGPNTWAKLIGNSGKIVTKSSEKNSSISEGDTGADVIKAQERLQFYGYFTGTIDGKFDYEMKEAVLAFQRRNGLTADGKIGPKTWKILNKDTGVAATDVTFEKMELGCSGPNVKKVQQALKDYYYYTGEVTGEYDKDTRKAVINFQESAGLTADGIVGEKTWKYLVKKSAPILKNGKPVRELRRTMRGYDVYVLQQDLVTFNYLSPTAFTKGFFDDATVEAVKAFQKDNHIEETGVVDRNTRRYLYTSEVVNQEEDSQAAEGTLYTKLSLGSHGAKVSDAQMRLKAAGFLLGNADGIFGPITEKAVKDLQKHYGLKVDGIIGDDTWEILLNVVVENADPDPTVDPAKKVYTLPTSKLYAGKRGTAVKKLQQMLIQLGYLNAGDDDGKFGPITTAAVIAYQKDKGLVEDGIVGTKTYVALYTDLGYNP
ncbi:MAG: hypothetical protein CW338_10235 [Clostridiales bacterium]|nr:hypothetical protein [Clostridiales bacterium]